MEAFSARKFSAIDCQTHPTLRFPHTKIRRTCVQDSRLVYPCSRQPISRALLRTANYREYVSHISTAPRQKKLFVASGTRERIHRRQHILVHTAHVHTHCKHVRTHTRTCIHIELLYAVIYTSHCTTHTHRILHTYLTIIIKSIINIRIVVYLSTRISPSHANLFGVLNRITEPNELIRAKLFQLSRIKQYQKLKL